MTSPSKRRELDITKLLLSDHAVELVDDNISEFYITFHGPKESESCGEVGAGSVFGGDQNDNGRPPHAAHGALPTPASHTYGVSACTTAHWAVGRGLEARPVKWRRVFGFCPGVSVRAFFCVPFSPPRLHKHTQAPTKAASGNYTSNCQR